MVNFIDLALLIIGIFNIILLVVVIYKNISIEVYIEHNLDKFTSEYEEELSTIKQNLKNQEVEINSLTYKFMDLENRLYNMGILIIDGGK